MDPLRLLWLFFIPASLRRPAARPVPRRLDRRGGRATTTISSWERELMSLYPQPRGRVPAVEYVPGQPGPERPGLSRRREFPKTKRREPAAKG